ncbi:MAG: nucleotidyltransferase family protein [Thermomonas sp.]|uniref:N-acetylmuramate alpha-1-phosphate uridylyltransferase MurU n=1 Tax=Thermomonas sp. TaxID=1971895 RepID=UPI001EBB8E64|nr:nucleotidyltransferase family protein [Thermomonas sp.]MBV2210088.1 nucleotidyltransferase family protein [Thermomonas sp.]
MKALIFAAGLGERMRPLTNHTPKPLLVAGGKPLIVWHLERLAELGVEDVVINTSWLAEQFPQTLGNGSRWGLRLHYVYEGETPLETGGGMLNALSSLGDAPFLAINGDIWCDFDFRTLPQSLNGEAHLVLVNNPTHHPNGDFALMLNGQLLAEGASQFTFAGIGMYQPALLQNWRDVIGTAAGADETPPRFKLAPLLRAAMARAAVSGQLHNGHWTDVGTPERLSQLNRELSAS